MTPHNDFAIAGQDPTEILRMVQSWRFADGGETTEDLDEDASEEDDADPHVDKQLDKGLKETFPASDPVSINPGAD